MAEYLRKMRDLTLDRLEKIRSDLQADIALVDGRACVYATGSFGRLEAGEHSDLDLFIVTETEEVEGKKEPRRLLDGISEIRLQYRLIEIVDIHGIKKFDAGGKYLASHTLESFTRWLGSNEDDFRNTLTGRMLLLLESKCLLGDEVYKTTIDRVIDRYFRDYEGHEGDFVPAFLVNDILRMWRTFCVNYEFYRKGTETREKLKNLKLKFSRMLTCFSGVIYLLAIFSRSRTVTPNDARQLVALTPTERLESLSKVAFWGEGNVPQGIADVIGEALVEYSDFLELTHQENRKAVADYMRNETEWRQKSYKFGASLSNLIDIIGGLSEDSARLRRLILI